MPYLLLVVEREERSKTPPEERRRRYDEMMAYTENLTTRGVLRASEALRPDAETVRVERRAGKRLVTDGPFAESKEMVGGFFLLDCDIKAEAIAIAAECPATAWAAVDVRETGRCIDD